MPSKLCIILIVYFFPWKSYLAKKMMFTMLQSMTFFYVPFCRIAKKGINYNFSYSYHVLHNQWFSLPFYTSYNIYLHESLFYNFPLSKREKSDLSLMTMGTLKMVFLGCLLFFLKHHAGHSTKWIILIFQKNRFNVTY